MTKTRKTNKANRTNRTATFKRILKLANTLSNTTKTTILYNGGRTFLEQSNDCDEVNYIDVSSMYPSLIGGYKKC